MRKKLGGQRKSHRSQGSSDDISTNAYSGWKLVSFTLFGERGPNLPFRDKCAQFCCDFGVSSLFIVHMLSERYGRKLSEREIQNMNMDLDGEEAEQLAGGCGGEGGVLGDY